MPDPARIEIYDGFFDNETLKEIKLLISDLRWRPGWKSSKAFSDYTQFHADFTNTDGQNREDASANITGDFASALLHAWEIVQQKAIRAPHALLRCYANLNVFGTEGYPHRDTSKSNPEDLTCVIYGVQGPWPLEWGGETVVCREDDIIKSVIPRENRLFLFTSNLIHIARGVTRACPDARVTLMFKSRPL